MSRLHPLLYEINTRCWLRELSETHKRAISLGNVPDSEFEQWQRLGFAHIWAMGVWTSGPRARSAALSHPDQRRLYDQVLPGWTDADIGASPYAISAYKVPEPLGGEPGLKHFRHKLHEYGLKLMLDFVPNHAGLDHPWLDSHPEFFVQSSKQVPDTFPWETRQGRRWIAHGKDPWMPAWTDTAQIDFRVPSARAAMTAELQSVASRCDGVRCDMAMLVLTDIFERTWSNFPVPDSEEMKTGAADFWRDPIAQVKTAYPNFLFLAEVYWNLEGRLQALGFDYTYDKTLYDRIVGRDFQGIQAHLHGMPAEITARCAHFLENHDERRVAELLSPDEQKAAALLILGLPGMRFLHEGQLAGAKVRIPVQMLCRPREPANPEIKRIYEQLLTCLPQTLVGRADARLLTAQPSGQGNEHSTSCEFVVTIQWQSNDGAVDLVVVNLSSNSCKFVAPVQCRGAAPRWKIKDLLFGGETRYLSSADLNSGFSLEAPAHGAQLFHFEPA